MTTTLNIDRAAAAEICKRCTKQRHDCFLKLAEGITQLVNENGISYEEAANIVFAARDRKCHWRDTAIGIFKAETGQGDIIGV